MLRLTIIMHTLTFLLVFVKLTEDILDRADIFILELQELQIPKPDLWEWLYAASILFAPFARRAMSKNSIAWMRWFHLGVWLLCVLPLAMGNWIYYADFVTFVQERDTAHLAHTWRHIPLAIVFQAFNILALQIHLVQLYFSYRLLSIWSSSQLKRKGE